MRKHLNKNNLIAYVIGALSAGTGVEMLHLYGATDLANSIEVSICNRSIKDCEKSRERCEGKLEILERE